MCAIPVENHRGGPTGSELIVAGSPSVAWRLPAITLSRSNESKPVALDHEVPSQCIKVELTALLLHDVLIPLQYCTIHASVGESTPTVRASPNAVSQPGEAAAPVAETGLVTAVAGGDSATAPDSPEVMTTIATKTCGLIPAMRSTVLRVVLPPQWVARA